MIFYSDKNSQLICADVRQGLKSLPDKSVHCCVTSPPYWGLRCYNSEPQIWGGDSDCQHDWNIGKTTLLHENRNFKSGGNDEVSGNLVHIFKNSELTSGFCCKCGEWKGELGLEPTPELFIDHLVLIFREVRRVLRDDGTLWLNLGDSFIGGGRGYGYGGKSDTNRGCVNMPSSIIPENLKPKDLAMIPARTAIALQADGWWLRNDIIWHKKNTLPESVTDRCVKSHEHIFLLTKSERYFFDYIAIQEPAAYDGRSKLGFDGSVKYANGFVPEQNPQSFHLKGHERWQWDNEGHAKRNRRDVWTINTRPYSGAHYATFPKDLPEICIKAGTSEKGCCEKCGKSWIRIVEKVKGIVPQYNNKYIFKSSLLREENGLKKTAGWEATCNCNADIIPCTVLDPFSGAGTTWLAAMELGRRFVGIEINEKDCILSKERVLTEAGITAPAVKEDDKQIRIFI